MGDLVKISWERYMRSLRKMNYTFYELLGEYEIHKMNFLKETLKKLSEHNKEPKDVVWVGDSDKFFSWEDFVIFANKNYDADYGLAEVKMSFVVAGADWWLERDVYDGSEWWEFRIMPTKPSKEAQPEEISDCMWASNSYDEE